MTHACWRTALPLLRLADHFRRRYRARSQGCDTPGKARCFEPPLPSCPNPRWRTWVRPQHNLLGFASSGVRCSWLLASRKSEHLNSALAAEMQEFGGEPGRLAPPGGLHGSPSDPGSTPGASTACSAPTAMRCSPRFARCGRRPERGTIASPRSRHHKRSHRGFDLWRVKNVGDRSLISVFDVARWARSRTEWDGKKPRQALLTTAVSIFVCPRA